MKKIGIVVASILLAIGTLWFIFSQNTEAPNMSLSAVEIQTNQKEVVDSNYIQPRFIDEVSLGNVKDYSRISKFARNPDIDILDTPEPVWSFGGDYNWLETGTKIYASSSNNGDMVDIILEGLDENWNTKTYQFTLSGNTPMEVDGLWIRTFRAYNNSGIDLLGNIYFYSTGTVTAGVPNDTSTVVCYIDAAYQQTLMSMYTIPAGKVGLLTNGYITMQTAGGNPTVARSTNFVFYYRLYGKVFLPRIFGGLVSNGNSIRDHAFGTPLLVPEKTDIYLEIDKVTSDDTDISAGYDIILIDVE